MIEFTPAAATFLSVIALAAFLILMFVGACCFAEYLDQPKSVPKYKGSGRYEPTTAERTMQECSFTAYRYQLEVARPPHRYSATSIQKAWLEGVCEVDITKLSHVGDAVEIGFTYCEHRRAVRFLTLSRDEESIMKRAVSAIEYDKLKAFGRSST